LRAAGLAAGLAAVFFADFFAATAVFFPSTFAMFNLSRRLGSK
jgi:hypothetical protein